MRHRWSFISTTIQILLPCQEKRYACVYRINSGRQQIFLRQTGYYGDRIPVWARFSTHAQTSSGAHPISRTMSTRSAFRVSEAGEWRWTPSPIVAEVEVRLELYIPILLSGFSWPVLAWTLPYLHKNVAPVQYNYATLFLYSVRSSFFLVKISLTHIDISGRTLAVFLCTWTVCIWL